MQDKSSSGPNLQCPLFVSAEATRQVLVWGEVVASLRAAYSVPHGPKISPPRVVARGDRTWLRALAAAPPGSRYMGAKIFGAGRQGMVTYLIALFEQESGVLAGLIDANLVTAYRTGATSAVAVDRSPDAHAGRTAARSAASVIPPRTRMREAPDLSGRGLRRVPEGREARTGTALRAGPGTEAGRTRSAPAPRSSSGSRRQPCSSRD